MAEFPALPFFTDAYLADTRHLTTEEHGAYLLLLICAWRTRGCALKDDDKTLSRIAGLSPTRWRRFRPVLQEFFTVEGGLWRQKKLTAVYAGVAARVARNKLNGAKGGRAAKAVKTARAGKPADAKRAPPQGRVTSERAPKDTATKTKTKEEQASTGAEGDFDVSQWRGAAAHACGNGTKLDDRVLRQWCTAGVCVDADMVPTIEAVREREVARTGQAPRSLAYYRDAVLEAAEARMGAAAHIIERAAARAEKVAFDMANAAHWRQLLGDPMSRFRGDYMARHWFVPNEHPLFHVADLGANPRLSAAPHIPADIHQLYGSRWGWLPADLKSSN